MRFYVYKRALMLTAATVALLSGPAYAAGPTTVTPGEKTALKTSTSGNITFPANGSLTIASTSNVSTAAAVTIDSSNTVFMNSGSTLTYSDTGAAIAIQANQGNTGEAMVAGTINLIGSGSGKTGIEIGNTGLSVTAPFIGTVDATNNTQDPTAKTAAIIAAGGVLNITGDGSEGIHLATGTSVTGDIVVDGSILMQPTNLTATTTTGVVTGVEIDGNMTGNFIVGTTGSIGSTGDAARGVVVLGGVNGLLENLGVISATGTASPATNGTNPTAGSAFVISNNVTGGFFNGGPLATGDTTNGAATLESTGNAAALDIEPGFGGITATTITIGGHVDPGNLGTFSVANRGSIISAPLNESDPATAIVIGSTAGTASSQTILQAGFLNAGTITATATTRANATSPIPATAISIGQFTTITGGILNSNQTTNATISAVVSGPTSGVATAIVISANSSVPSLNNSGTIAAQATTSDVTVTSESAFGVFDASGSLVNVNNTGAISARAAAIVNGTFAALNNNLQISQALNLAAAQSAVTINNTGNGTITGDIILGAFGDTITTAGSPGSAITSTITGNINFGSGANTLTIGSNSQVIGDLLQSGNGALNITVAANGRLDATNNGLTSSNRTIPTGTFRNLVVSNLNVSGGAELDLTLSNAYNINNTATGNVGPIVQATTAGTITLQERSVLQMNFGGFVTTSNANGKPAQFIVFDTAANNLHIADPSAVQSALTSGIPFLFTGSACAYNVTDFTACSAATPDPAGAGHSDIVLSLTPKNPATSVANGGLGLTGYALAMFEPANNALSSDDILGAAVIQAGASIDGKSLTGASGSKLYQQIYSAFAPDVTGSARAIAISITDQSSGIVGERQRKLRMYAGQDSDATLWAQEFGQRLNVPNTTNAGGYNNSGFGMAVGMDSGSISSGRYGGALTFYAGSTSEKDPRESKTSSEWYMATAYSDWRGKGLFFDSQLSAAYGNLRGKRTISIDDLAGTNLVTRTAEGKRSSEMLAGGFSTGFIMNWGGTVLMPQVSVDGLTLREEGYTESGGGPGMDLRVQPYYANSLRGFLGADLRQDLKIGDFYLQPEARAGFRYDALDGAAKLHVQFAGDQSTSPTIDPGDPFTIKGPDPARGNLVLGGGLAVTTDAWSIGVTYDYARGIGGTKGVNQDAMLTLVGRI